jgi:hypothetical protein
LKPPDFASKTSTQELNNSTIDTKNTATSSVAIAKTQKPQQEGKNKDDSNNSSSSAGIAVDPQKGNVKLKTKSDPLVKKVHSKKEIPKVLETTMKKSSPVKQQKNVTNRTSTSTGKVALASNNLYGFSLSEYQTLETAMDEIMKEDENQQNQEGSNNLKPPDFASLTITQELNNSTFDTKNTATPSVAVNKTQKPQQEGKNKDDSNNGSSSSAGIVVDPLKRNVKLKTKSDPLVKKVNSKKEVPKVSETMMKKSKQKTTTSQNGKRNQSNTDGDDQPTDTMNITGTTAAEMILPNESSPAIHQQKDVGSNESTTQRIFKDSKTDAGVTVSETNHIDDSMYGFSPNEIRILNNAYLKSTRSAKEPNVASTAPNQLHSTNKAPDDVSDRMPVPPPSAKKITITNAKTSTLSTSTTQKPKNNVKKTNDSKSSAVLDQQKVNVQSTNTKESAPLVQKVQRKKKVVTKVAETDDKQPTNKRKTAAATPSQEPSLVKQQKDATSNESTTKRISKDLKQHDSANNAGVIVVNDTRRVGGKHCFYYPFCTKLTNECGGTQRGRCREVKNGNVTVPEDKAIFRTAKKNALHTESSAVQK